MRGVRRRLGFVLLSLSAGCGDDSGVRATSFGGTDSTGGQDESSTGLVTSISASDTTMVSDSATGSTGEPDTTTDDGGLDETSTGEPIDPCDEMDTPDINGLDENGDGIDGLLHCSVFVNQVVGSDLNDGIEIDDPVATIQRGIEISQTFDPPRMVLVAAGNYQETVNLYSGVSIYGGYDPESWDRDVFGNVTEITGQGPRTVIAESLDTFVELDGFTINAASYTGSAQSTYAVWVRDIPDNLLLIDYCEIYAGDAGAGADGANGMAGEDGGHGTNGSGGNPGSGGVSACNATGGNGGSGQICPSTGGTNGSAGGDPTTVGQGGPPGTSDCSGSCGDEMPDGSPGQPGHAGVNGSAGETGTESAGTFAGDGLWVGPAGSNASRGYHGSGGGGGGAGGYDIDGFWSCPFYDGEGIGGGGGGGGAGGCGGQAGAPGQSGGGSFGIVAILSSINVTNTAIFLGAGGDGGNGGNGGNGGTAGLAGAGAAGIDNGGEPGDGANGGNGGGGGGGGGGAGGCGGASVGIARVDATTVGINNVSFHGGTAGSGGQGGQGGIRADGLGLQAPAGQSGCQGFVSDQATF